MRRCRPEPMLEDLLNDPILDVILDHDRLTRDDLHRVIQEARRTLARVPREWHRDHSGDR
jgi:L-aminopeptidase/D-esterase-like protein